MTSTNSFGEIDKRGLRGIEGQTLYARFQMLSTALVNAEWLLPKTVSNITSKPTATEVNSNYYFDPSKGVSQPDLAVSNTRPAETYVNQLASIRDEVEAAHRQAADIVNATISQKMEDF